ncbi:13078_t:CDS:1 [Funneliformis caledonium]|uniref:13078_t:CDS:1 n=1 Tax=Funneliformis caledonium TaxID=1117310 RepID=A0A9N9ESS1_9GLOM|nr:13078_t:CDS:1 [Funneliformis caledonium]
MKLPPKNLLSNIAKRDEPDHLKNFYQNTESATSVYGAESGYDNNTHGMVHAQHSLSGNHTIDDFNVDVTGPCSDNSQLFELNYEEFRTGYDNNTHGFESSLSGYHTIQDSNASSTSITQVINYPVHNYFEVPNRIYEALNDQEADLNYWIIGPIFFTYYFIFEY